RLFDRVLECGNRGIVGEVAVRFAGFEQAAQLIEAVARPVQAVAGLDARAEVPGWHGGRRAGDMGECRYASIGDLGAIEPHATKFRLALQFQGAFGYAVRRMERERRE